MVASSKKSIAATQKKIAKKRPFGENNKILGGNFKVIYINPDDF